MPKIGPAQNPLPQYGTVLLNANNVFLKAKIGALEYKLGLVQNLSFNENFQLVPTQVLGFFGTAIWTASNYQCSLNIGMLILEENLGQALIDGGDTTALDIFWSRAFAQKTGRTLVFDEVHVVVGRTGVITDIFRGVALNGISQNIQAGQPVMRNLTMQAIEHETKSSLAEVVPE